MKYTILVRQVRSIIDLYEKHAELSGERFNIFSIMGMESDEVKTHSAILAELLNPKGNHSLGSKPLKLLIKQVFGKNDSFIDYTSAICQKEVHIGKINEDKTEGGRVDLILKDKIGCKLVIENKIYASEQINQLMRYQIAYPEAKILYLTLEGDESKLPNNIDYQIISYKTDVLSWIESCAKEAYDKPMVREVLNQYAYLLRTLTNQSTSQEMSDKVSKIITENYQESLEIYNNFEKARVNIVSDIFKELNNKVIKTEDGSAWSLEISDKIWDVKNHKTILISRENDKDSKVFFFVSYRYSSPKLSKGIVPKSEVLAQIKKTGMSLKKYNTIQSEIMNIVGRNDLIVVFENNKETFITTLVEEIKQYIEIKKDYLDQLNNEI